MKNLTYHIIINRACSYVFDKISDKSVYPDWAKAWGDGMTYIGEWKQGGQISFFDNSQGGTKVLLEAYQPHNYIKARHIAMVNPNNEEVELTDESMQKWIGSLEEYIFTTQADGSTKLEVVMTTDEFFQPMFDAGWPKALKYFKEVCER